MRAFVSFREHCYIAAIYIDSCCFAGAWVNRMTCHVESNYRLSLYNILQAGLSVKDLYPISDIQPGLISVPRVISLDLLQYTCTYS